MNSSKTTILVTGICVTLACAWVWFISFSQEYIRPIESEIWRDGPDVPVTRRSALSFLYDKTLPYYYVFSAENFTIYAGADTFDLSPPNINFYLDADEEWSLSLNNLNNCEIPRSSNSYFLLDENRVWHDQGIQLRSHLDVAACSKEEHQSMRATPQLIMLDVSNEQSGELIEIPFEYSIVYNGRLLIWPTL